MRDIRRDRGSDGDGRREDDDYRHEWRRFVGASKRIKTTTGSDVTGRSSETLKTVKTSISPVVKSSPTGSRTVLVKDAKSNVEIHQFTLNAMRSEEEGAVDTSSCEDLERFRLLCQDIRVISEEVVQAKKDKDVDRIEQLKSEGALKFLSLKVFNRWDKFRTRDAKEKLQVVRQKVDTNHLQLQNLLYEVMHKDAKINNCKKFRSKDEDIELISLEEFFAIEPNKRNLEPHQLHLARLDCELEQRKQLEEKMKVAEAAKKKIQEAISQKRDTLDKLQPMLKMMVEVSQPLYQDLSLPLQKSEAINTLAEHLPRPLFVLYVQAAAFRHATKAKFEIDINGTAEEAKVFQLNSNEKDDDDDDDEEERISRSKKKRHRKSISLANKIRVSGIKKLIAAHPLSVILTMDHLGSKLRCQFIYVFRLEIVSVRLSVEGPNFGHPEVLDDCLLTRLFGHDDGLKSPNPANAYLMSSYGIDDLSQVTSDIGYPYDWVQRIAGLDFINTATKKFSEELSIKWMHQTIDAIKNRFACRKTLQQQLQDLSSGSVDWLHLHRGCWKKPKSTLKRLYPLSRTSLRERIVADERLSELIDNQLIDATGSFVYSIRIERGSASLEALVFVPVNYPTQPSFFRLHLRDNNSQRRMRHTLRDLEALVNCHLPEQMNADRKSVDQLLTLQVRQLMVGFDAHLEAIDSVSLVEEPKEFSTNAKIRNAFSGRDHVVCYDKR